MPNSLAGLFFERAPQKGAAPLIKYKEGRGPYREMSWQEFAGLVKEMAYGLAALGLKPGDKAAILTQTSHFFVAADLAIMANGAATVPLYPTSSSKDLIYILENSEARHIFVHNEALLKKVLNVREKVPHLDKVILLTAPSHGKSLSDLGLPCDFVIGLEELTDMGRTLCQKEPELLDKRLSEIDREDLATIIYTSGTTGTPKGAMLTHSNILSLLDQLPSVIPVTQEQVYLSYLPLSHVFERVCGEFYGLHSGGVIAFAEGVEHMAKNMAEVQPTMLLVVPRILDRIYAKMRQGIDGATERRQKLIEWSIEVGKEMFRHKSEQKEPRALLKLKHWIADKLVLAKLRERLSSRLNIIVSGGAPANAESIEFFNAIGITCMEGYGLTETAAPTNVNTLDRVKVGTVGPCIPTVEIKLAEDGEILFRGPSIFKGYYKQEEATSEVFEDGWFKTGDIGAIDQDGYLKITDRKKDLIINAAGKNIAPQRIEATLSTIPFVNQAVVFGDKKKHLVALLVLDEQQALQFAHDQGFTFADFSELIALPDFIKHLRKEIQNKCKDLSEYERVRNFAILAHDLSIEAGELTASMKVKRQVVASKYKDLIEPLFQDEDPVAHASSKR